MMPPALGEVMGVAERKQASPRGLLTRFLADAGRPAPFQSNVLRKFSVMVLGLCLLVSVFISTAVILCPDHPPRLFPLPFICISDAVNRNKLFIQSKTFGDIVCGQFLLLFLL